MSTDVPKGGLAPYSRRVMNLAYFLRQSAKRYPNEIALVWGQRTWTWAQIDARVEATAAALAARGVGKGDRVLVQAKNSNQFLESMFVCFRLGAVWVPTNFRLTAEEVDYLARASGATAMICGGEFPDHARAVMEQGIKFVISIGSSHFGDDYDGLITAYEGRLVSVA